MELFKAFIDSLEKDDQKETMTQLFHWIQETFPQLDTTVKWNQPMYTDHDTFIIGFSKAKQHFSIAPETKAMDAFSDRIDKSGYAQTNNLFKIKWTQDIDYDLLKTIIQYNIDDKQECTSFWRK
ncbi:DUF1801 domain-containing protein [Staphylococcus sp. ACRSN]|uniref:iron chaperone n=1 Tax=Staphylococcus sp. ACRSN TaxID=2918214 RepID=UPI001EF3506C|nr:DUF1801 domain-containing protein [Staphylococcus sp. ACRSN]MCG7337982.1 DUF1801 domain-containing protein [Staphylococcus sp. ACRSN]